MKNIQATGQLYGEQVTVKQISKRKAEKLFSEGKTVYLQSSNMHPFGMWQSLCPIQFDLSRKESSIELNSKLEAQNLPLSALEDEIGQFNHYVDSYTWYNCDNERGKYANFYANINDLTKNGSSPEIIGYKCTFCSAIGVVSEFDTTTGGDLICKNSRCSAMNADLEPITNEYLPYNT